MLEWSHEAAGTATGRRIRLALTHEEIGQIIGMSRETVTRTLADFRKQHIAELHGSTLLIENTPALQELPARLTSRGGPPRASKLPTKS